MNFKVGDKVKLKNTLIDNTEYGNIWFSDELFRLSPTIIESVHDSYYMTVDGYAVNDEMIEPVELKFKIGDRVRTKIAKGYYDKGDEFTIGYIADYGRNHYKEYYTYCCSFEEEELELVESATEYLYHVGDRVKIKDGLIDGKTYGNRMFVKPMAEYPVVTIKDLGYGRYCIEENDFSYTNEMIEGLAEEPIIKDSGERREFSSGAVRDVQEGKGRCDLLPLRQCYEWSDHKELLYIQRFIETRNINWICSAMTEFVNRRQSGYEDMDFAEILLDVSKHYEEGAKKYEERNWEKGIPLHAYIDSGVRHFLKCMAGYDDEPHNRAFIWNMLGAIWTLENKPEFDDLPEREK